MLSTELVVTAWDGRAENGNGFNFFLLKGRGCGQRGGEEGDGPARTKSFGTTGFSFDAASIASVPVIPSWFTFTFEPEDCEYSGSLEVEVEVGSDPFFLDCRDLFTTRGRARLGLGYCWP